MYIHNNITKKSSYGGAAQGLTCFVLTADIVLVVTETDRSGPDNAHVYRSWWCILQVCLSFFIFRCQSQEISLTCSAARPTQTAWFWTSTRNSSNTPWNVSITDIEAQMKPASVNIIDLTWLNAIYCHLSVPRTSLISVLLLSACFELCFSVECFVWLGLLTLALTELWLISPLKLGKFDAD